jgi:uncharacterized protein
MPTMRRNLAAFAVGLIFAIGLAIGGMTDPVKVIAFLDVTGDWDPSLAFVMGGAVAVYAAFYRRVTRRHAPVLESSFHLPTRRDIDRRLIFGALLFGAGWGLGGYCPGPAIVSTMSLGVGALVFTGSMLAGMALHELWSRGRARTPRP